MEAEGGRLGAGGAGCDVYPPSPVPVSEEAERLWRRREADWAREERARRHLMEDVVASWRQQSERRLERCRADRQREAELREAAAAQAEQQRRFVEQTEELRRQRQAELRDSWARQVGAENTERNQSTCFMFKAVTQMNRTGQRCLGWAKIRCNV